MSRRSSGQRGAGRIPKGHPVLDLSSSIFGIDDAIQRFANEQEGCPVFWVVAGPHGPRARVREALDALQEAEDITRWRELWGLFQVWAGDSYLITESQ